MLRTNLSKILQLTLLILVTAGCSKSNDKLIQELSSDKSRDRLNAATILMSRRGDKDAIEKLKSLLNGKNECSAFIAIQILASMADTSVIPDIGKMVSHPNPFMRIVALRALGGIGYATALPYIVSALKDKDPDVRYEAANALGNLYELSAIKYIYPLLRDDNDSVRVAAVQSLYIYRHVKGSEILAADLAPLLSDKSERVRYVCAQALGGGFTDSTTAGDLLIEALNDESSTVRKEAIISIKKIRYAKAVPALEKMYEVASVEEEYEISDAVKTITGEDFPKNRKINKQKPEK